MNPQILKLAEQAGMYVDLNGKPWPKWMGAEECEQAYARFAELIVRKCGEVAYKAYWNNPETVRGVHIQEKIKQHFGVEE
jgi:hypothetical protein